MEVIELSKFRKTPAKIFSCAKTQPFMIAFVYSKDKNCVIKGMGDEVETYIAQHFPFSIYYYSMWKDGKSRGSWRSPKGLHLYVSRKQINNRYIYTVSMRTKNGWQSDFLKFRNFPKKWLPIYDQAIYE